MHSTVILASTNREENSQMKWVKQRRSTSHPLSRRWVLAPATTCLTKMLNLQVLAPRLRRNNTATFRSSMLTRFCHHLATQVRNHKFWCLSERPKNWSLAPLSRTIALCRRMTSSQTQSRSCKVQFKAFLRKLRIVVSDSPMPRARRMCKFNPKTEGSWWRETPRNKVWLWMACWHLRNASYRFLLTTKRSLIRIIVLIQMSQRAHVGQKRCHCRPAQM